MSCEHPEFNAVVGVARIQRSEDDPTIIAFAAEVHINCRACGEAMTFIGPMAVGDLAAEPTVSPDGTELRAPIRPLSAAESFGLERTGFRVNWVPLPVEDLN